jgi:hypothetical protein
MCERVEVVTVCVPMLGWTIALLEFKSLRRHRGKGKAMAIGEVFRRRIYGSSRIRLALRGGDEGQPRFIRAFFDERQYAPGQTGCR